MSYYRFPNLLFASTASVQYVAWGEPFFEAGTYSRVLPSSYAGGGLVYATVIGGGGGGTANTDTFTAGDGGGSGGIDEFGYAEVAAGATVDIVVGAGAAGSLNTTATVGGTSSFSSVFGGTPLTFDVTGGQAGAAGSPGTGGSPSGVAGASNSGSDAGNGGSLFGLGGPGGINANGGVGVTCGDGGGGGDAGPEGFSGGAGHDGAVIVSWTLDGISCSFEGSGDYTAFPGFSTTGFLKVDDIQYGILENNMSATVSLSTNYSTVGTKSLRFYKTANTISASSVTLDFGVSGIVTPIISIDLTNWDGVAVDYSIVSLPTNGNAGIGCTDNAYLGTFAIRDTTGTGTFVLGKAEMEAAGTDTTGIYIQLNISDGTATSGTFDVYFDNLRSVHGWDVTTTAYESKNYTVSHASSNSSLFFKSDGLSMYIIDSYDDYVYQHTLSTAWDVSTASYASKSFNIGAQTDTPISIFFKPNGLSMYVLDSSSTYVYQYTLSTAWDVSTASYASKSYDAGELPVSIFFKPDGLSMYVLDASDAPANQAVYQHTLSTAWDVSTASYASKLCNVSSQITSVASLFFKSDGLSMYVMDYADDTISQYTLSTAWDVSTASYASKSYTFTYGSSSRIPVSVFFKPDGLRMFVLDENDNTIYQHSLLGV